MLKKLMRVFFFLVLSTVALLPGFIKIYKIMNRRKSGSRHCLFCFQTALQELFY